MLYVGTSGWQYSHWKRVFYPDKLPQRGWLPYFAARFQTVEVNNTFYNLPDKSVFEQWRANTPDDFLFALKMSRYLTHLKRLHDPGEPVHRFLERARALGSEREALRRWVSRIGETWPADADVFVYFNNDTAGYAIKDAIVFAELADAAGLRPTRVPSAAAA